MKTIQDFINSLDASFLKKVSPDFVVQYIADESYKEDPEEGLVPYRVRKFEYFYEVKVPVCLIDKDDLETDLYCKTLVARYVLLPADEAPPIVLQATGEIIDGFHRTQACLSRKDEYILAYVGQNQVANFDGLLEQKLLDA